MRWAVIGSTGLFGQDLLAFLKDRGEDAHGFHRGNLQLSDDPSHISNQIEGFDVWVNCMGYTQVDKAESESSEAKLVNGIYAGVLAEAAALDEARFIQISTDYVFDGSSRVAYDETALVDPRTAYGKSKVLGEQLVAASGADYSILRTAWLYGAGGRCFPKVIANRLRVDGRARVVNDQIGQPTWTKDLADMVLQVAHLSEMPRILHATASGKTSWAGFAKEIAESIGINADSVTGISSKEYPTAAKRPSWSVLGNSNDKLTPIGDWLERWRLAAPEILNSD